MIKYKRITIEEREQIMCYLIEGLSYRSIGQKLGRHASSICREVKSFKDNNRPYSAQLSQRSSDYFKRCHHVGHKLHKNPTQQELIHKLLRKRWSPMQICLYLKHHYPKDKRMHLSHESIYTYIYLLGRGSLKKELIQYLRQKKRLRKNRKLEQDKRGIIADMISIDERPAEVADRSVPGHWEGDLIIGKNHKSALGTIVERNTRTVILVPLKKWDATSVRKAFAKELLTLPEQMRLSMTYDRGKEMAQHKLFTKQTKMVVYFCHPASPWQRGTCENTNMLIRDFFPKKTDFNTINRKQIKEVQHLLNERPRKTLNWKTPKEVFNNFTVALKT